MERVSFEFGGRILRHQYVAHHKFGQANVPLKPNIRLKPREAVKLLFGKDNQEVLERARGAFLCCPGVNAEGEINPGFLSALAFTKQIWQNDMLRASFLIRNGEARTESVFKEAVIGRLGDPAIVLEPREGSTEVAQALKLLLEGDIAGFNDIRKKVDIPFDFSGITALGAKDLRRVDTFEVRFSDIVDLSPVARKNSFGFVKINSGFCAGMRIDARMDGPALVFEYFIGELLDKFYTNWLGLKDKVLYTADAEVAFYPRRPQFWGRARSEGQFIFEDEYLANAPKIRQAVESVLKSGKMPVTIGGDHSIAFATQGTINDYYMDTTGKTIGLVWIDAHADINTEHTSPSGNLHGGPVAGLLGLFGNEGFKEVFRHVIDPKNLVYISERDLDPGEIQIIEKNHIRWFKMDEIKRRGIAEVMEEAYQIATDGTAGVSVSFDIDAFDAKLVPGTGTPVTDGLDYKMGREACQAISAWEKLLAFELVEINPANDIEVKTRKLGARVLLQALLGVDAMARYLKV